MIRRDSPQHESYHESYRAPTSPSRAELREQGSRFLALLEPVRDEASARERVVAIAREHPGATHCCFA